MYIDETQMQGHQLLCDMQERIDTLKALDLIEKLSPEFSRDGNQWCYKYGGNSKDGIYGFGDTAAKAAYDFYTNFWNNKAIA